jgi:hypothetical protein
MMPIAGHAFLKVCSLTSSISTLLHFPVVNFKKLWKEASKLVDFGRVFALFF